jgi:hypothetical protein
MKDNKYFPDNVSIAELTVEQATRAIETCSTGTLRVGAFDPDMLFNFISRIIAIHKGEDVEIIATHNNISKSGGLIAIIHSDPKRYITVVGMKDA